MSLSSCLSDSPDKAPARLSEVTMRLTGGESAGISLEDVEDGAPVFRWVATAGELSRYLRGTMPRHFSPCGTVVDRGRALVMSDPGRYYDYVRTKLHVPIRSALLVPYGRPGTFVGTLWVLTHTERGFTTEDVRAVQSLATFASTILDRLQ